MRYDNENVLGLLANNTGRCQTTRNRTTLLRSSTGGVGPLPILTDLLSESIAVVSVPVDTRELGMASVWLNFSSIVTIPAGTCVILNFQILRTADDGSMVRVGSTYTLSQGVTALETESFGFQFVDSDLLPGNYTYAIEISTNSIIDCSAGLTLTNATLTALAVAD